MSRHIVYVENVEIIKVYEQFRGKTVDIIAFVYKITINFACFVHATVVIKYFDKLRDTLLIIVIIQF